ALVTVLTLVPALGVLIIRNEARFVATLKNADPGIMALRRFCDWIAQRMVSHPGAFSLVAVIAVASLGFSYSALQPSYRLADQVPDKEQAVAASGRLDAEISGSNPVYVLLTFPPRTTLYAPETLSTIAEVHKIAEGDPSIGNVWSLESLR